MKRIIAPQHHTIAVNNTTATADERMKEFHAAAASEMEALHEIAAGRETTPTDLQMMAGAIARLNLMVVGLQLRAIEDPALADLFNEMDASVSSVEGAI